MNTDQMSAEEYIIFMAEQAQKKGANGKYSNNWVMVDGINFQSQTEANRYKQLKYLKEMGMIKSFTRQHLFKIFINGILITTWRCDFIVYHWDGSFVVEDVKGFITSEYIIKKNLMKACYGITIVEPNLKTPASKPTKKKRINFKKKK